MPNKEKREKKGRDFALCVKITEKVALNIASEASYIYNLSGQKLMKNAKNSQFGEFLTNKSWWSNSVARHVNYDRTKIDGKCKY